MAAAFELSIVNAGKPPLAAEEVRLVQQLYELYQFHHPSVLPRR
jgi:hypothetical protein